MKYIPAESPNETNFTLSNRFEGIGADDTAWYSSTAANTIAQTVNCERLML